MAQSLRRPLCSVVGLSSSLQRRPFTQASPQWAGLRSAVAVRPKQSVGKSMKVLQKQAQARGEYPTDVGLVQDTFVTPQRFPSLFESPRKLLRFQYLRLFHYARDLLAFLAMKASSPRGKRWYNRSLKLHRSAVAPEAVKLHSKMYTAFAEGNVPELRKFCCDGIFESFRLRIAQRERGERVHWELLKMNKAAKVVSDRLIKLPGVEGGAIRQAVVRICSRQRLSSRTVGSRKEGETGKEKDAVEYVVVQQKLEKWSPQKWMVWGTTKETTLEEAERWRRVAKGEA